ncbi:hypothetical protein BDC45DRAFT_535054 [Circinella umbellata]|nr:hypothetical protein BDC45DRAFT_535054 [Circinella umbellata]
MTILFAYDMRFCSLMMVILFAYDDRFCSLMTGDLFAFDAANNNSTKTARNKASTSAVKKKTPRPTTKELEEAAKGLHSLTDAIKRRNIMNTIPNDYDIGILAIKLSRLNLNSGTWNYISYPSESVSIV